MKRYKCTNYKRFLTVVSIFFLLLISLGQLYKAEPAEAQEPLKIVTAIVRDGDSLWKLAEQYDNNSIDLRIYIDIIQRFNDMDSTVLQPGQKIRIPIY